MPNVFDISYQVNTQVAPLFTITLRQPDCIFLWCFFVAVTSSPNRVKYHPDCQRTPDHTGELCSTDGFHVPPTFQVVTGDHIQDITGDEEEEYYLRTSDMYRLHR